MDCFNLISRNFKIQHFICADLAFLNQSVTGNNDKEFPLGMMPMLSFRDAGFRDIYAELSAFLGFLKLCKATSIVAIHL